jgi:hypothetical protein
MKISSILNRLYSDYLMPCRLPEMRKIYEMAASEGYEFHSVVSFWDALKFGVDPDKKYFISRHDIDTDVKTARMFFALEYELGVRSSFYFRLSSLDYDFMKKIEQSGSEASYHFEEIATLSKKNKWKNKSEIDFDLAGKLFEENFSKIKKDTGLPMRSVCSHGDFVNRKLNVVNHELLDYNVRESLKIELETYDQNFMKHVGARHSDTHYPKFYMPVSPVDSIKSGMGVVYFLTHPRHWRSDVFVNTSDNVKRIIEGFSYRFI